MKIKQPRDFGSSPWLLASKMVLERSVSRRTPRRHNEATDIGSFSYSNIHDENVAVHSGALLSDSFALSSGASLPRPLKGCQDLNLRLMSD